MSNKPDYIIYLPVSGSSGAVRYWVRGGGGWKKLKDGREYISCKLDVFPVDKDWNGQINLMPNDRGDPDGEPF